MFTTIYNLLSFISLLGSTIGAYMYLIKKERTVASHIWAYSFFIFALTMAMEQSYGMMVYFEVCAIYNYMQYRKRKWGGYLLLFKLTLK